MMILDSSITSGLTDEQKKVLDKSGIGLEGYNLWIDKADIYLHCPRCGCDIEINNINEYYSIEFCPECGCKNLKLIGKWK